jgi:hypothetical protein
MRSCGRAQKLALNPFYDYPARMRASRRGSCKTKFKNSPGGAMSECRVIVAAIVLSLTAHLVLGQSWDGGGANDNLTTAANWNPNVVPINNGTADLVFAGTVRLTPKVNTNYDVDTVSFAGFEHFVLGTLNNSTLTVHGGIFAYQDAAVTAQGGTVQFNQPLANADSGIISGRGTLLFYGSFTNQARMQFSGGPTDIYGNVNFTGLVGGGELINSGAGNVVTFYGDVNHNGDEIRTSPSNTTVFFRNGGGPFTGAGVVRFEGTFSPGNSPARVAIEGDILQGASSRLEIELAGTSQRGEFDQIQVGGLLSLAGTFGYTTCSSQKAVEESKRVSHKFTT